MAQKRKISMNILGGREKLTIAKIVHIVEAWLDTKPYLPPHLFATNSNCSINSEEWQGLSLSKVFLNPWTEIISANTTPTIIRDVSKTTSFNFNLKNAKIRNRITNT
jgi:hypothetical protein